LINLITTRTSVTVWKTNRLLSASSLRRKIFLFRH